MKLDGRVDVDTPSSGTEPSVSETISAAWSTILASLKDVCHELSMKKYGHTAGNLTNSDIATELKKHGVDSRIASVLAKRAYDDHERFRWSDDGKKIVETFHALIEK